jgi:hypothetical protein
LEGNLFVVGENMLIKIQGDKNFPADDVTQRRFILRIPKRQPFNGKKDDTPYYKTA